MANKQIIEYGTKTSPIGSDKVLLQETGGLTVAATLDALHQAKVGFFDYNDLATTTTPITHTGSGGYIQLTNDTLGAFTNTTYKPNGMTQMWNSTTNRFDFAELTLGDMVDLRVDCDVTTTSPNQEVIVRLQLGIGGTTYTLELDRAVYKTAGTYRLVSYTGFYMGDTNTISNAGEIQLDTDSSLNTKVNGWYLKITKR